MITEWIIGLGTGLWGWIAGLLPDWELPPELADPNGPLATVFALGQGLEPFVAWDFVGLLAAIPIGVWVVGLLWKAARTLLSHIPFVGGH